MIVAKSLLDLPRGLSSYQSGIAIVALLFLVWLSARDRSYRLTVAAGLGAIVGLFALADFLYRLFDTWPSIILDERNTYTVLIGIIGAIACAASLRLRNSR